MLIKVLGFNKMLLKAVELKLKSYQGPLLLTRFNFNPGMNK